MADHVISLINEVVSCKTDELFPGKYLRSEHCLYLVARLTEIVLLMNLLLECLAIGEE